MKSTENAFQLYGEVFSNWQVLGILFLMVVKYVKKKKTQPDQQTHKTCFGSQSDTSSVLEKTRIRHSISRNPSEPFMRTTIFSSLTEGYGKCIFMWNSSPLQLQMLPSARQRLWSREERSSYFPLNFMNPSNFMFPSYTDSIYPCTAAFLALTFQCLTLPKFALPRNSPLLI